MDRKFLLALLSNAVRELDINNQYQCHAFINLRFVCSACGVEIFFNESEEDDYPTPKWCRSAADKAQRTGWFISPPDADGNYDLTAHCPACNAKRGI